MLSLRGRRPRAHARAGARLGQVDRGVAAEIVPAPVGRHVLLVRAPAEFGGLHALRAEALDRPGVDEDAARLRVAGALGVALGDVDALDAEALHQPAPALAVCGFLHGDAGVARDVEQRLLDHPGHHAGIGPAAAHGGGAAGTAAAHVEHAFAQGIVRALRDRGLGVGVEAGPRLADGVDVVGVDVLAEVHQVGRRGVDRQVDDHAAAGPRREQRGQHLPVVVAGEGDLLEAQAALVEQRAVGVDRVDDHELRAVEAEVALEQRQHAAADRAEADQDDRAGEAGVQEVALGHAGECVHIGYSERGKRGQAACAATAAVRPKRATSAARSGLGASRPVGLTSPRAPASAAGCSSSARNRFAS